VPGGAYFLKAFARDVWHLCDGSFLYIYIYFWIAGSKAVLPVEFSSSQVWCISYGYVWAMDAPPLGLLNAVQLLHMPPQLCTCTTSYNVHIIK
jgi:hypothetical protein